MPFKDVEGKTASVPPAHIAATELNVGVTGDAIVTTKVVVAVAHWPAAGVNV
jgi:hypothetical protein